MAPVTLLTPDARNNSLLIPPRAGLPSTWRAITYYLRAVRCFGSSRAHRFIVTISSTIATYVFDVARYRVQTITCSTPRIDMEHSRLPYDDDIAVNDTTARCVVQAYAYAAGGAATTFHQPASRCLL